VPVEVLVSVLPGTPDEVSWMVLSPYAVGDAPSAERRVLAEALARLAALPVTEQPLQTVLHEAAHICQDVLGNDGVLSVNVGDPRSPTAVASTDTSAQQLDGDQMSTDQGPCFDAFDQRTTVVSNDLSTDDRWPVLAQHAAPLAGAVSAPLQVGEDLVGMLNVYVTGTPDRDLVDAVELLSTTIAALLVDMQIRDELLSTAHQFELALTSRATIDQAKGVIMAHRHCGPEEAFQHLVDLSSARNVKLRDLAKEIVERASM
jgi:transcriptional regulator with GAF, ATPase, and Fis domain